MPTVEKVSLSLKVEDLQWARAKAEAEGVPLSAVMTEALHAQRRFEAMGRYLAESGHTFTQEEIDAVTREWTR
jgi:hypothetical protein